MTKKMVQSAEIKTNITKDSICKIEMHAVKFDDLWEAYPSTDPCDAKDAQGGKQFKNQCAIRVSYALKKVGVTFKSYPKKRKCWVHQEADHILAAKELADWLELQPFVGCRKSENVTDVHWVERVKGRTGIICFEDYYAPSEGSGGDHIDLWNGNEMTGFMSGLRTRFGIVVPFGVWSDLRKAKKIRFFHIG